MAHVKWYFRHSAARVLRYVLSHGEPGDALSAHGCAPETAIDDFASTRAIHRSRGDTQVIHVMQSWSTEESHLLGREKFHEIGRKLSERYFPGHEFVIKTHTDKAHTHNHIVVNAVNAEMFRFAQHDEVFATVRKQEVRFVSFGFQVRIDRGSGERGILTRENRNAMNLAARF